MIQLMKSILVITALISNLSTCMEMEIQHKKRDPNNPADLLKKNGRYLKKLIAIETNGNFSPKLIIAEQTLQKFFKIHTTQKLEKIYDEKTIKLGHLIAQRPNDYLSLWDNESEMIERITNNPY